MNLSPYITDGQLLLKVIPNAKTTKIITENNLPKLYVKELPDKDKANKAVIKFFKKTYSLNVEIIKGKKSRDKVLRITSKLST